MTDPSWTSRWSTDLNDVEDFSDLENDGNADNECLIAKDGTRFVERSSTSTFATGLWVRTIARICYGQLAATMSLRRRYNGQIAVPTDDEPVGSRPMLSKKRKHPRFRTGSNICLWGLIVFLAACGLVSIILVGVGYLVLDPRPDTLISDLAEAVIAGDHLSPSVVDLTTDVVPVPCHSHNDYWRQIPLFEALHYGMTSVEADAWFFEDELFVGHDTASLRAERTLRNLYLNPLLEILDRMNPSLDNDKSFFRGVFNDAPEQTLVMLVDIKAEGYDSIKILEQQLGILRSRGYLSHFNGTAVIYRPITVVCTGETPFDALIANTTYRDLFFDAPLDRIWQDSHERSNMVSSQQINREKRSQGQTGIENIPDASVFTPSNSYYASMPLKRIVGWPVLWKLTQGQIKLIREQVTAAHNQGLKVRYWDTPDWPVWVRNHVWNVLLREGVDMLNVDDLKGAAKGDWRDGKSWLW